MARSKYRTHNEKVGKDITDDLARFLSEQTASFVINLREELEQATPKDTGHGAINWLIRRRASGKEYGDRSDFPQFNPAERNYNQPTLSDNDTGVSIARGFDIRKGRGNLTVFNNVDYVTEINEGTHPAQQEDWIGNKKTVARLRGYIGFIEDVEKTVSRVEGKHGF